MPSTHPGPHVVFGNARPSHDEGRASHASTAPAHRVVVPEAVYKHAARMPSTHPGPHVVVCSTGQVCMLSAVLPC